MIAHTIRRFAQGGMHGIQSTHRDWSPFVAHFTSYSAMAKLRDLVDTRDNMRSVRSTSWVRGEFARADNASFTVFKSIVKSSTIRCSHPAGDPKTPECVCLSECNLPSLITHAERYGRFGFIFRKETIFSLGGRPCAYFSPEHRDLILESMRAAQAAGDAAKALKWSHLAALSQQYIPQKPVSRTKPQDFTHEREWRIFAPIDLKTCPAYALLTPGDYVKQARAACPDVDQVISLDDLFDWGA